MSIHISDKNSKIVSTYLLSSLAAEEASLILAEKQLVDFDKGLKSARNRVKKLKAALRLLRVSQQAQSSG
jgi:predicted metal-binding protein